MPTPRRILVHPGQRADAAVRFNRLSRLERKGLILVFVAVTSIQSLGEVWNIRDRAITLRQDLDDHAALSATITARSIATPLKERDMVQVENAFTALRTDPDFVGVTLLDREGALQARLTANGIAESTEVLFREVPVIYSEVEPAERLGKLQLGFSPDRIQTRINGMIYRAIARSVLVMVAISAALMLIARQITRPLAQVRKSIDQIQLGNYTVVPEGLERTDEIGEVLRAVDGFRLNAIEMEELRRTNDRAGREERRRIRAALESTQDAALIMRETGQIVFQNAPARIMLADLFTNIGPDLSLIESPADQQLIQSAIMERKGVELNATVFIRQTPTSAQRRATPVRLRINPIYDPENAYLGIVILATDITEQVRAASHINHLANHDSLTGLSNRRLLEEQIDAALSERGGDGVSLILMDLDRFKLINDTHGHPAGDELLISVANHLRKVLGNNGLAARLGGDEFALLFSGPKAAETARQAAREIVSKLSRPVTVGDKVLGTGASIGLAMLQPGRETVSDALRKADLALYEAKKQGRGRFIEFEDSIEQGVLRKTILEEELRTALKGGQITPVFQRQITLSDNSLDGFEALARWEHPTLGPISPAEFIGVAETTNQIEELTHQMLTHACRAAAGWRKIGFGGHVSVNISPQLFGGPLLEMVQDILLSTNCPPEALELEITEAVLLTNSRNNLDIVEQLRASGICVALDDFGMGYSSLSYLQSFPVDRIKIDRAFVTTLETSQETAAIVTAIVALGHALSMKVTAEGVETEEQLTSLRAAGVDCVQGFIHGRPVSLEQTIIDISSAGGEIARQA